MLGSVKKQKVDIDTLVARRSPNDNLTGTAGLAPAGVTGNAGTVWFQTKDKRGSMADMAQRPVSA